jgi:transaldolase
MATANYLQWLAAETPTHWWHDSAEPRELGQGKAWGASGATTNPVLAAAALRADPDFWRGRLKGLEAGLPAVERAEKVMEAVVKNAAASFEPVYRRSDGTSGYVCAQVNPALCGQAEDMLAMARRFHAWAPNISVKLPATAAGMAVLEECAAEGICVTSTVSFTVPQVVAAAEAYRLGSARAERSGRRPAPCYAVIMIGRLDDYLREVAADGRLAVAEEEIRLAGLAVTKRAYAIFRQRGYRAQLLVAALRGVHHMAGLCGGELVMSIHPGIQKQLLAPGVARNLGIEEPIPAEAVRRLEQVAEFRKAYREDGLAEKEFIGFGLTQKTLSQFSASGWSLLEAFQPLNS